MSDWRADVEIAIAAFATVSGLARDSFVLADLAIEHLTAPRRRAGAHPRGSGRLRGPALPRYLPDRLDAANVRSRGVGAV